MNIIVIMIIIVTNGPQISCHHVLRVPGVTQLVSFFPKPRLIS